MNKSDNDDNYDGWIIIIMILSLSGYLFYKGCYSPLYTLSVSDKVDSSKHQIEIGTPIESTHQTVD